VERGLKAKRELTFSWREFFLEKGGPRIDHFQIYQEEKPLKRWASSISRRILKRKPFVTRNGRVKGPRKGRDGRTCVQGKEASQGNATADGTSQLLKKRAKKGRGVTIGGLSMEGFGGGEGNQQRRRETNTKKGDRKGDIQSEKSGAKKESGGRCPQKRMQPVGQKGRRA